MEGSRTESSDSHPNHVSISNKLTALQDVVEIHLWSFLKPKQSQRDTRPHVSVIKSPVGRRTLLLAELCVTALSDVQLSHVDVT